MNLVSQELWDYSDDWTGISSPTERRKRQNRLSQRAARKRKHARRVASIINVNAEPQEDPPAVGVAEVADSSREPQCGGSGPNAQPSTAEDGILGFRLIRCPRTRHKAFEFIQRALADYSLRTPRPSDLHTVSRMNLLSAFANNAVYLGICFEAMFSEECISPFNLHGPSAFGGVVPGTTAPETLRPTETQKAVIHHPWIDLIPIAGMRDNILRGLDTGYIEEEDLCRDLATVEVEDGPVAPIAVWGPSWNTQYWEIGERFLKGWSFLVQGCPEAIEVTNYWRTRRGETPISLSIG